MERTVSLKVDFMRKELHKELESCVDLTDSRVVMMSQLLDEFIVEGQKQLNSKSYQDKKVIQM